MRDSTDITADETNQTIKDTETAISLGEQGIVDGAPAARTSQAKAGFARSRCCVHVLALLAAAACTLVGSPAGLAQDPSKTQPLYLQGDELIYDNNRNRVIARGKVEIYFNNNILIADEVIYDQGANTLTAEGNAQLKEPNGNIVRADKLVTSDDFRDAFLQSLSVVAEDDTRIAARRAVRRSP